jgi:hypothetical protein
MNEIIKQLEDIERMLNNVKNQVQELREGIRGAPNQDKELSVPEFYEHPWYKYKREQLIASGNYQQPEGKETTAA